MITLEMYEFLKYICMKCKFFFLHIDKPTLTSYSSMHTGQHRRSSATYLSAAPAEDPAEAPPEDGLDDRDRDEPLLDWIENR